MRRFTLTTFVRFVPPLFTRTVATPPAGAGPASPLPSRIERLHVERAHAAAHPVHLPTSDVRKRAELGPAVRGYTPGSDTRN